MEETNVDYYEHKRKKLRIDQIFWAERYIEEPQQRDELVNKPYEEENISLFPLEFHLCRFIVGIVLLIFACQLYSEGEEFYAPYCLWGSLMSFILCFFFR